jgi:hypothetical protein
MVLTQDMCRVRSHNKQRLLPYTILVDWFCTTEVKGVYCAVRTKSYSTFGKSLCTYATIRRFGCQYCSCRCSVLLFHCIQLLNSG